jgi:hypothetical protein
MSRSLPKYHWHGLDHELGHLSKPLISSAINFLQEYKIMFEVRLDCEVERTTYPVLFVESSQIVTSVPRFDEAAEADSEFK